MSADAYEGVLGVARPLCMHTEERESQLAHFHPQCHIQLQHRFIISEKQHAVSLPIADLPSFDSLTLRDLPCVRHIDRQWNCPNFPMTIPPSLPLRS